MKPTLDWLQAAEKHIRKTLDALRPQLLETQGKIEHTIKDDKSAVTAMDTKVEDALRDALAQFDASIGFSGEESGADYTQKTFWLVDPIDGTEPFIRGIPTATNMIALIDNGQSTMGVINNFCLGDYYLAIKGRGATCNGHPVHVSKRPMDGAFISVGNPTMDQHNTVSGSIDRLRPQLGRSGGIFNVGATGYTLAAVASGAIEGRLVVAGRSKPWDYAPGTLLIQEAGGQVANIGADTYDYRDVDLVAANNVIFDELMRFAVDIRSGKTSK